MSAYQLDPLTLFDGGFGEVMVPVTAVGGIISPRPDKPLLKRDMGKAPGLLTGDGWVPVGCDKEYYKAREHVPFIKQMGGNLGLRSGLPLGLLWIDNDQGEEFSSIIEGVFRDAGIDPLRRYVEHPKHKRDAFLLALTDMVGPVEVANRDVWFRKGVMKDKIQVLARHKHAVAWGVHNGTFQPYVWNRNIVTVDDVPVVNVSDWANMYGKIISEIEALGWTLESGQRTMTAQAPQARQAPQAPQAQGQTPNIQASAIHAIHSLASIGHNSSMATATPDMAIATRGAYHEVLEILMLIPNDPAKASSDLNRYFDLYENYIRVAYMIFGALGNTADARNLWLQWAHQRPQSPQDHPERVWSSVANQPTVVVGMSHLVMLVQRFGNAGKWAEHLFATVPDIPDDPNDPLDGRLKEMLDTWAFAYASDNYVNLVDNAVLSRPAFNALLAAQVPEFNVASRGYALKKRQRLPRMSDLFDPLPKRQTRKLTYAPGDPVLIPVGPQEFDINTWRPSPHGKMKGVTALQVGRWLDHVEFVLGSLEERDRFLRWCAYAVQFPERKANWHWLVMSVEGFGKDTMLKPVCLAVGPKNYIPISIFDLGREFNYYAEKKMVVISETKQVNTVTASAHDTYAVRLKPLLASPPDHIVVNRKNRQEFEVANRHALFMFSNEKNPLWLGDGSRRVHVIDRMDEPVKSPRYYARLNDELDKGLAELAASYLHSYPLPANIDVEMHGVAPDTPAKQALQAMNHDPLRDALEEIVDDARLGAIFPTLLVTPDELLGVVKARTSMNTTATAVNRHLMSIKGVRPVTKDPSHIGPGTTSARKGNIRIHKRLWRLGDKTHDGVDLVQMSNSALVLFYHNGVPPKTATVTSIVKAKLAQAPDLSAPFVPDPNEEV